jgi:predicted nucleic acid-binding protein
MFTGRVVIDTNVFVSGAVSSKAYIVSGDEHLLGIKYYRGIQIVDAKSFLKILGGL